MKHRKFGKVKNAITWLILGATLFCMLIGVSSCYTENKARRQVIKAHALHPDIITSFCGSVFDPLEFVRDSFIYIPGETNYLLGDTIIIDCDTVRTNALNSKLVKVPCPPIPVRVDTVYRSKEVQLENKAKISSLQNKIDDLTLVNARKTSTLNMLWWAIVIVGGYTLLRWILKMFTPIKLP